MSDQNYKKLTKSNKLTLETKIDIIVKAPTASQYYEDDDHPLHARNDEIFNLKNPNPVPVASG